MRVLAGAIVTLAVAAAVAVPSPRAEAAVAAECGDVQERLLFNIESSRVGCTLARRVARQWASQCAQLRTGSCLVTALFYCRYRKTGFEEGAIQCTNERDLTRCVRAARQVHFVTGS